VDQQSVRKERERSSIIIVGFAKQEQVWMLFTPH